MKTLFKKVFTAEFMKFVVVGIISAVIEYCLYFLFKNFLDYLVANVIAFGFTNILTFILSRRFVFTSSNNNKAEEATLYFVCLIGALLVNQMVLWVMVEFADMAHSYAKVGAISVAVFWNFFTRKHIVFRNRQVVAERSPAKSFPTKRF